MVVEDFQEQIDSLTQKGFNPMEEKLFYLIPDGNDNYELKMIDYHDIGKGDTINLVKLDRKDQTFLPYYEKK